MNNLERDRNLSNSRMKGMLLHLQLDAEIGISFTAMSYVLKRYVEFLIVSKSKQHQGFSHELIHHKAFTCNLSWEKNMRGEAPLTTTEIFPFPLEFIVMSIF